MKLRAASFLPFMTASLLCACSVLPEDDFEKATFLGEIELGGPAGLQTTKELPPGKARLILAVRDFRCRPLPRDEVVEIRVRSINSELLMERLTLSQLTWSYGETSCHAFGYSSGMAAPRLEVEIPLSGLEVHIDVTSALPPNANVRRGTLWFVYGGRVPTYAVFGVPESAR